MLYRQADPKPYREKKYKLVSAQPSPLCCVSGPWVWGRESSGSHHLSSHRDSAPRAITCPHWLSCILSLVLFPSFHLPGILTTSLLSPTLSPDQREERSPPALPLLFCPFLVPLVKVCRIHFKFICSHHAAWTLTFSIFWIMSHSPNVKKKINLIGAQQRG